MKSGVGPEYRLEGATNFLSWKIKILLAFRELELDSTIENPPKNEMDEDET